MLKVGGAGGEVLLVAHTRLSLEYVLDHYRLLRQDPGLRFTLTRAPDQYPAGVEEMMDGTGLRRMPYCAAVRRAWDLALFGTHGSEIFFTAGARVHIQHGLGAGKLVDGQDYTYGPKWATVLWGFKTDLMEHLRIAAAHDAVLSRLVLQQVSCTERRDLGELSALSTNGGRRSGCSRCAVVSLLTVAGTGDGA